MTAKTQDLRVVSFEPLEAPAQVVAQQPLSEAAATTVLAGRDELRQALSGRDRRFVAIIGPCSIHDPKAALEYAGRLMELRERYHDRLLIVMRVYFEKPRTSVGWKGLINDPRMNGSHDIVHGLKLAREILLAVNELGLPCATEFLDPIVPQYTSDLVSWAAIGARTTESQTHRQMASGLSMPVGFKNATAGGLQVAIDAMVSARAGHAFVGIDEAGRTSVVKTTGNPDVHLVLRGSGGQSNYSKADIAYAKALLGAPAHIRQIMIDCSHGNSNRNFLNQPRVFEDVVRQFAAGEHQILGNMTESNLVEGKQNLESKEPGGLVYGQSITDACIGWKTTAELLASAYAALG